MEQPEQPPQPPSAEVPQVEVTVRDALHSLTAVNQDLFLLDYGNVIIQRRYQSLKTVRLLGGGLGGGDLCQAICVGRGMLTAAILGEDSVPSSRDILRTIKELNEGDNCGVFVIVQAGPDLFNFGLAVERANADCRSRVKLLSIDDYKGDDEKVRYSCGFILLAKVLGAMAELGFFFDEIYNCYENIVEKIVTVPLHYEHVEVGLLKRQSVVLTQDFVKRFQTIIDKKSQFNLSLHPSVPTVILINTSRALSRLAELGLVKQVIEKLKEWGVSIIRLYYGSFITMTLRTAYLTVMKIFDMKIIEYLDAQSDASGWHQVCQFLPEITFQREENPGLLQKSGKQEIFKGAKLGQTQSKICAKAIEFGCEALMSCERQLNTIDQEKSRGNMGSRLRNMAEHVQKRLINSKLSVDCPYALFKKLGVMAESAIGGAMGSIYGVLFETAANVFGDLPEEEVVTPFVWARVYSIAANAVQQYSTERDDVNMFYPIRCAEQVISKEMAKGQHYLQAFGLGVSVAEEAAIRTKLPLCKYPDVGAHAVGIWMRAVFEAVKLTSMPDGCDYL